MLEWYGRNLITFAKPTGEMYAYTYNADGIRTSKNYYNAGGNLIGTDEYIYDGTKLIAENRSGTWLYYFYDANGTITGMSYNGTMYYFRKNLQGDVTGIYNATGNLVVEYEYTPYGALLAVTDASGNDISANATHIANINPIRYRGYYYDTETGFYYLQTRYYDPVVGRFVNADNQLSTGDIIGLNLFAYCGNNPPAKSVPNPNGKEGGAAHQAEIQRQVDINSKPGYEVKREVKILTPGGAKPYRYADFSVTNVSTGETWYGNVGLQLKSGAPCPRERQALADIINAGKTIEFFPYN